MKLNKYKLIKGAFIADPKYLNESPIYVSYLYGCLLNKKIKDRVLTRLELINVDGEYINFNAYWYKSVNTNKLYRDNDGMIEISNLLERPYGGLMVKNIIEYSESGMQGQNYSNFDFHGDRL